MLFGNQLAGRALDAKLGPLLANKLGLPVQLAPITAHLFRLKAETGTVMMGDTTDPALVATNVEVSLELTSLMRGEIRLHYASADNVMLRLSRWPSSDTPLPHDYQFLDQWLPSDLQAQTGYYVDADGEGYLINEPHWRRQLQGGASVQWWEQREAGKVAINAELKSLQDLLLLAPVEIDMTMQVLQKPNSQVSVSASVQPSKSSAYSLKAEVQAADMTAKISATGQAAWRLPERSDTRIALLKLEPLVTLFHAYSDSGTTKPTAAALAMNLPRLALPAHEATVAIKELQALKQVGMDTSFTVVSSAQGVQVDSLTSVVPKGILTADLAVNSDRQGWTVTADADVQERARDAGLGSQFIGTDWLWNTGHATVDGSGDTWENLLNSLQGTISLAGHYNDQESTPISIEARLDSAPGRLALNDIAIELGKGQISGSAALLGEAPQKLAVNLKGENLTLDFLVADDTGQTLPGIAIPSYLNSFPDLDLDVTMLVSNFRAPDINIARARATLARNAQGGKLLIQGTDSSAGSFKLDLEADRQAEELSNFKLKADFNKLDFSTLFRQGGVVFSRTSGKMQFAGSGVGIDDSFKAMHGSSQLTVKFRRDNNWQTSSTESEKLVFSGESYLLTDNDRIVGVRLEKIDIESFDQDLTGTISITSGSNPWFVANLKSEKINIAALRAFLPTPKDDIKQADPLAAMSRLGEAKLSLNIESLILDDVDLLNVEFEAASAPRMFKINTLNFTTRHGVAKSQGDITWEGEKATVDATAQISDIDLDQFLIQGDEYQHVPVSGSAKLHSEGTSVGELISSISGYVNLQATAPQPGKSLETRRSLELNATQLSDGIKAEITTLHWGESELSGNVVYRRTSPQSLDIKIRSSYLSLLPWEHAELAAKAKSKQPKAPEEDSSGINKTAKIIGDILLTPLRLIGDNTEEDTSSSAKLFSAEPLPISAMKNFNILVDVELDSLKSNVVSAKALRLRGKLTDGKWLMQASLGQESGGNADVTVSLDISSTPAVLSFTSNFNNMLGLAGQDTFPRSGFVSFKSQGGSEAELAATTSGLLYAEMGQGPYDYSSSALFTNNLVSSIFTSLIPGVEREKPEVKCGVILALFQDGKGITPYGFALRTNDANVLGNIQMDLGKETIDMSLDSRGRQGVGISVGSVFSNTVDIKGPLTDPSIVPNAASIVVRGWAAVMTAGLSVLGETMFKRILASENPCPQIKKHVIKDLCPKNTLAASSQMVCPKA